MSFVNDRFTAGKIKTANGLARAQSPFEEYKWRTEWEEKVTNHEWTSDQIKLWSGCAVIESQKNRVSKRERYDKKKIHKSFKCVNMYTFLMQPDKQATGLIIYEQWTSKVIKNESCKIISVLFNCQKGYKIKL